MKITELIAALEKANITYGDLECAVDIATEIPLQEIKEAHQVMPYCDHYPMPPKFVIRIYTK